MILTFAIILALVAVSAILVAHGMYAKHKWVMDLESFCCPYCYAELPAIRWPCSFRQFLWGGWTCSFCTTKVDKRGREIGHDPAPRRGGKAS